MKDRIYQHYITENKNCAESVLLAANEKLGWNLSVETIHAIGPFGGGLGCGRLCGAIAGACAAIGVATIREDAHKTPELRALCTGLVEQFVQEFGSDQCSEICKTYKKPDVRCLSVVEWTADILEKMLNR
jgi:C_GCAxxG_C_C family probable redox protein